MPDPIYRPREYLRYPRLFGLTYEPEMVPQHAVVERARSRASRVQCGHAHRVRTLIAQRDVTRKEVAASIEMSYQRLSRLLSGEIVMRFEDLARLQQFFEGRENVEDERFD